MATLKTTEFFDKELVTPTTPNETNDTKGDNNVKVLVNDCKFTIRTDRRTSFVGSKIWGHGLHVMNDGNINIQCGPKRWGGGKLVTISRGGQITKTGPCAVERNGYRKSFLQEGVEDSNDIIAYKEINTGNVIQSTNGTLTIKATNIKIEADDTLTLQAGDSIIFQSEGSVTQTTGKYTSTYDTKLEKGSVSLIQEVPYKELFQKDPRSSDNIITSGHINRTAVGDYSLWAAGIGELNLLGNKAPVGSTPLITNRSIGLLISCSSPSAGFGGISLESKLGSIDMKCATTFINVVGGAYQTTSGGLTSFVSGLDFNVSAPKGIGLASGIALPTLGAGDVKINALKDVRVYATGEAKLESVVKTTVKSAGNTEIVGAIIMLN